LTIPLIAERNDDGGVHVYSPIFDLHVNGKGINRCLGIAKRAIEIFTIPALIGQGEPIPTSRRMKPMEVNDG